MRCTPVGTWTTKRGIWRGPGKDNDGGVAEESKIEEDTFDPTEQKTDRIKQHTYANRYDAGFIFEALWKKRYKDATGKRVPGQCCPEVRIPDTVIYKSGYPAQWYFQSKQEKGKILRKNKRSLTIPKIYDSMAAWNGICESQIVACFVGTTGEGSSKRTNNIVFFDRKRLKDFVYGENLMRQGFLQRFVAPEAIPFDHTATNVTLHVTWSPYKCIVEQRVNKVKLNNKKFKTSDKVNLSSTRVDTGNISPHTRLHHKINEQCRCIAEHVRATTFDQTDITNMTCYFKIGENDTLWLLFVSSVAVSPSFQDAFGYIVSLHTFAGRHSPELICPDFFGIVDAKLKDAAEHDNKGSCALCNISHEEDSTARSYAVTYKMLADFSAADRTQTLENLRYVSVPEIESNAINNRGSEQEDDINIQAKASALFTMLDTQGTFKVSRIALWAGLLDFGYTPEEIAHILDIDGSTSPMTGGNEGLKTFLPLSEADLPQSSPVEDLSEHGESDEEPRPYTPHFDEDDEDEVACFPGDDETAGQDIRGSLARRPLPLKGSFSDMNESSFESQQSTISQIHADAPLQHAKDLSSAVKREEIGLEEFTKGIHKAYDAMSPERKARFVRNVDLCGHADHVPTVRIAPSSPVNAFVSVLRELDNEKEAKDSEAIQSTEESSGAAVEVNVDFARDAVDRSRARQLARRLPKSLMNLRNVLPASHIKRIISSDSIQEDFGSTRIWCCKKCAMKFNETAESVFKWSDEQKEKANAVKVAKKLDNLRHLKKQTGPYLAHNYPIGELPALCTPRMYRALHDHASRSYTVGPPQFTAGGCKDILGETLRTHEKLEFRKPRLPQLDRLPVERADDAAFTKMDADMCDLLDRLGLTPRRPVKGHFGSHYKPKKAQKGQTLTLAELNSFTKQQGPTRKMSDPNAGNAFDWLEGTLHDLHAKG